MFFFKTKKIVVDCFTTENALHEAFHPDLSVYYLPEWWKNFPKTFETKVKGIPIDRPTIRYCDGIRDLYKSGFVIPFWSDLIINSTENMYNYHFSHQDGVQKFEFIHTHNEKQYGKNFDKFFHLKIIVPWILKEKTGVKMHFMPPFWNYPDQMNQFFICTGTIKAKYPITPNVNFFIERKENTLRFNSGDPLIQIIPQSEKEIEIKSHLVDQNEYRRLTSVVDYNSSFLRHYDKITKKLVNKEKTKCPFGF